MSMFDLLLSVLSLYLHPELYFPLSNNVLGRVGWPGHPLLHQHPHLKWEARDLIYFSFYFIFFFIGPSVTTSSDLFQDEFSEIPLL